MSADTLQNNDIHVDFKMEGSKINEVLSKIKDLCKISMPADEQYVFMSTNITKKTFNYFGSTFAANYVSENDNFVKSFIQHCYSSILKLNDRIPTVKEEQTDPNLVKEINNIIEQLNVKKEICAEKAPVPIRENLVEMVPVETEQVETVIGNNVEVETVKAEICQSDRDERVNNAGSDYVNDSSGTNDYEVEKIITRKGNPSKEKPKFKCTKCTAAYRTEALFQNHMNEHDIFDGQKGNDNSCPECSKVFSYKRNLRRHYRTHHSQKKLYECKLCNKTFIRPDGYKNHLNLHEEPKWKCPQCQKPYHTKQSLTTHLKNCNEKTQLKCQICKVIFIERENLDLHVCHSEEPNNLTKTYLSGKTEDGKHICGICQKVFKKRQGLLYHRKLHSNQSRISVCKICNKIFNTKNNLKNHEKYVHSSSKDYVCEFCGKGFTTSNDLKKHLLTHNPEREKLACPVCGNFLASQASLNVHMNLHADFPQFVCETCGKTFKQRNNFLIHMKYTHTEASFQCEICPKMLKSKQKWRLHMRLHVCREECADTSGFKSPKIYDCNICSKKFVTSYHLKTHLRTHSNMKPYICDMCEKSYKKNSSLKRHKQLAHQI